MKNTFEIVRDWLRTQEISFSTPHLKELLLSHTDYPSVLSISDTLAELGVRTSALRVGDKEVSDLALPFLAHKNKHGGEFVLIQNLKERENLPKSGNWEGVVLIADPTSRKGSIINQTLVKEERNFVILQLMGYVIICLLVFAIGWLNFSSTFLSLILLNVFGLLISIASVLKENGKKLNIMDSSCKIGSRFDCNTVISHRKGKLSSLFTLSDLSVTWFVASLISIVLTAQSLNLVYGVLGVYAILALPIVMFSIYIQSFVIRIWCPLCLVISLLMIVQVFIFIPYLNKIENSPTFNQPFLVVTLIFISVFVGWLKIRNIINEKNGFKIEMFRLRRFKNDPDLFNRLLLRQDRVHSFSNTIDIQIGSTDAPLQLIIACDPHCRHCANTIELVCPYAEVGTIGVAIMLVVHNPEFVSKSENVTKYLLQSMVGKNSKERREIIKEWYEFHDIKSLKSNISGEKSVNVGTVIKGLHDWTMENGIEFTPTIFLNGYKIPSVFSIGDILKLPKSFMYG